MSKHAVTRLLAFASVILVGLLRAPEVRGDTWQIGATNRNAWDDTSSGATDRCEFGDKFWDDSCGLAWPVTIPPGAKILSANVRVFSQSHVGDPGAYTARIRVEDVDNAAVFTGAPNNVRGRTYWSTTVDWNLGAGGLPNPAWSTSPDITALIQHIVDRPGWASGNYINVAIWGQTNAGAGGAYEDISVYPTNPAELVVTYALPLYRSVGINASDLNIGGRTVQIAGSTATFSGSMPANVGVGDVLVYNSGGNQLAFIAGRTSSTVYTVTDKGGVTPAAAPGGTAVGVFRAYTSLSNWEGQIENPNINEPTEDDVNPAMDLVTAKTVMMVACYNDGPMDDAEIDINGWTTGADNYIRIFTPVAANEVGASQRHRGKAGTGFRLVPTNDLTSTPFFRFFYVYEDFVRIEGLELDGSSLANGRGIAAVRVDSTVSATADLRFEEMIIHDLVNSNVDASTDSDVFGFLLQQGGAKIRNTILYNLLQLNTNASSSIFGIQVASTNTGTSYFHNNTFYHLKDTSGNGTTTRGIQVNGGTVTAKNDAVLDVDSTSGPKICFQGTMTQSNNVSSDATAVGVGGQTAYSSYFADITAGLEDLHLLNDSLTLWGSSGADLDTDPNLPVTVDIDGDARDATAPDIGADEVLVIPLYRSVGLTAADLNTGAQTVSISSTHATFSGPMPDNIGVGDVLQYQVTGTYYVALIEGRISSTEYLVRKADGGAPQPATAGTAVGVYRAYTSLSGWQALNENASLDATVRNFDTSRDLVTNKAVMNVACYGGGGPDATPVTIDNWTTDASHYIRIYAPYSTSEVGTSQRHAGVWDASKYSIEGVHAPISIGSGSPGAGNVWVDGLQVYLSSVTGDGDAGLLVWQTTTGNHRFSDNLIRGITNSTYWNFGIFVYAVASGSSVRIWNNIIYDFDGNGTGNGMELSDSDLTGYVYNNTVYNCFYSYNVSAGTATAKNNIAYSSLVGSDNYMGTFQAASTNNLSGPTQTDAPPSNARQGVTVTFVDAAGKDFHLAPGDTGAQDFGADLSSDANLAFTGDIDLGLRTTFWDIGADDVLATTAVKLSRFTATGYDSEVLLEWETGSEIDNLGFQLYRATAEEGPYERITTQLIPGLGSSPEGARYRYVDDGVVNGRSYYYELEDVETTGKTKRHGPVAATPESGPPRVASSSDEGADSESSSLVTFGDPSRNRFRVLSRTPDEVVLELRTEGLYAEPLADGTVNLYVPDFQDMGVAGAPDVPVARRWVDVLAGRKVRLAAVRVEDVVTLDGWTPANGAQSELEADARGTVRLSRRRARRSPVSGWYPGKAARIVEVGFQRDVKKALLDLSPLQWSSSSGRLRLARRLEVRLSLRGREPGEISVDGRKGRRRLRSSPRRANRSIIRLVTRQPGLYSVSYRDVFGTRRSRPKAVRLSTQGREVAYHLEPATGLFGPGSTLYFVSDGADSNPNGNEAVVELETAEGTEMEVRDIPPSGPVVPYAWQTLHREENHFYQATLVDAPDLWLWDALFAPVRRDYAFTVRDLAPTTEAAILRVRLQGASDFEASPDHHLLLSVNGTFLCEEWLEGKESRRIEAEIPPGLLREGDNLLEVENVGDTGAAYSMVMLDDFDVVYLRRTAVDESGALEAEWDEGGIAVVSGASIVLDVTDPAPSWVLGERIDAEDALRFQAESGHRYLSVSAAGVRHPEVRGVPQTTLRDPHQQADYVILGPRTFLEAAAPLVSERRSQGLSVRTVAMEDVASEFGYGEQSPEAIRSFLDYAYHDWAAPSPRYLLLLGDATYDPKDYLGTGTRNDVPSFPIRTSYLWTVSDLAYGAVNGDDTLADLAVGRIPASSVEEVRQVVEKILVYEGSGIGLEKRDVLVADNSDAGGDFVGDAEELSRTVLAGRDPKRIYLSQLGVDEARREVLRAFDEGSSIVSYLGHGGIQLWASEQILTTEDVPSLSPQSQQPIVLTMNCLNGYFQFPYFDSLSEELLKPSDRGAIATFSPSGFSLDEPAHRLHRALLEELLSGKHHRLGDAILAAQQSYAATGADPEILEIYQLLGDPALLLR